MRRKGKMMWIQIKRRVFTRSCKRVCTKRAPESETASWRLPTYVRSVNWVTLQGTIVIWRYFWRIPQLVSLNSSTKVSSKLHSPRRCSTPSGSKKPHPSLSVKILPWWLSNHVSRPLLSYSKKIMVSGRTIWTRRKLKFVWSWLIGWWLKRKHSSTSSRFSKTPVATKSIRQSC